MESKFHYNNNSKYFISPYVCYFTDVIKEELR